MIDNHGNGSRGESLPSCTFGKMLTMENPMHKSMLKEMMNLCELQPSSVCMIKSESEKHDSNIIHPLHIINNNNNNGNVI